MNTQIIERNVNCPIEKEDQLNIKQVLILNAAAGNEITDPNQYEEQITRQNKIDLGECFELLEAVSLGDMVELRDALSDKRVTLNGFSSVVDFSLSKDFDQTMKNLFTRFDKNEIDAVATQQKYAELGVATYIESNIISGEKGSYFVNKVAEDCTGKDGSFYPKGKFLKSVNFTNDSFNGHSQLLSTDPAAIHARWCGIRLMLTEFIDHMDAKVSA